MIRSLIREFLLQEEVFGAQAFVYHGSKAPPDVMLPVFLEDKFTPGVGIGSMYGKGLYAVYDLPGSKTESGKTYGQYIYKLKVNLYGFISFDPEITRQIYKKDLSPSQQAELVGTDEDVIERLRVYDDREPPIFSADWSDRASRYLRGYVKGIVYTGRQDGRCIVLYDVSVAVPVAWKTVDDRIWTKVDRESMKPSLRRSSTGEWEKEKYDINPKKMLDQKFAGIPPEQRIWEGNLDLSNSSILHLPDGLKVEGNLDLSNSDIQSLPQGLEIGGFLNLKGTYIQSLPLGLKVGGELILRESKIKSLPDGLQVGGNLNLENTFITSLPIGLRVGGTLNLSSVPITSLPDDISVEKHLYLARTKITSLPIGLKIGGNLDLRFTKVTSLPDGLQVGGQIWVSSTKALFVPPSAVIGKQIMYGMG